MSAIEDGAMQNCDLVRLLRGSGEFGYGETGIEAADALEALAAELTRLRERNAELEKERADALSMLHGVKGPVSTIGVIDEAASFQRAWRDSSAQAEKAEARIAALEARNAELEKAAGQTFLDNEIERMKRYGKETIGGIMARATIAESRVLALEATVREMREALEPFAQYAPDAPSSIFPDDVSFTQGSPLARRQLTFGDLRRARAALAKLRSVVKIETSVEFTDEARASFGKSTMDHFYKWSSSRAKETKMASEKAIDDAIAAFETAIVENGSIREQNQQRLRAALDAAAAVDGDAIRKKALMEAAEKAFAEANKFHQAMFDLRDDGAPLCAREYQEAGDALRDLGGALKALCENDRREDEGVHPAVDGDAQREALAQFMIRHSFPTGHGDTHADLLANLEAHMQWNLALREVAAERRRQIEQEGWTPEHDDEHTHGEMARAAASYAVAGLAGGEAIAIGLWPWSREWWRPKDRRRDLVRSAALIVAEIERLDRAAVKSEGEKDGEE